MFLLPKKAGIYLHGKEYGRIFILLFQQALGKKLLEAYNC
jgi:hypothetical protein